MRALRVVIADGGLMTRSDLLALCEQAGFDIVGEAPEWPGVPAIAHARSADLILVAGDADFAAGLSTVDGALPSVVFAPDARAAKEYADCGAAAVLTPSVEPEVLSSTAQMIVQRFADLRAARAEISKLRDQLETRKVVERAKGILMQRLGIDEATAYRKIQRASQDENRRMRDIAESILSAEKLYEDDQPGD